MDLVEAEALLDIEPHALGQRQLLVHSLRVVGGPAFIVWTLHSCRSLPPRPYPQV